MSNNQQKDYFKILGITEKDLDVPDPKKVVQNAFRRHARECHPDVSKAPDAEEKFKELNEAYDTFSDREKLLRYLKSVLEQGLNFGQESYSIHENRMNEQDVLGGLTFKLANIGFGRSGIALKDVLEAYTRFYNGEDIQAINEWILEQSIAWKLVEPEEKKGMANLYIMPHMFLIDSTEDVFMFHIVDWVTQKKEGQYIQPGDFVDIRNYIDPESRGITNVQIGNFKPQELGDVLDMGIYIVALYQSGEGIKQGFQEIARNVLRHAGHLLTVKSEYDETTVKNQSDFEHQQETHPALPATLK